MIKDTKLPLIKWNIKQNSYWFSVCISFIIYPNYQKYQTCFSPPGIGSGVFLLLSRVNTGVDPDVATDYILSEDCWDDLIRHITGATILLFSMLAEAVLFLIVGVAWMSAASTVTRVM